MAKKNDVEGFVRNSALIAEKIVGFFIAEDMRKYYRVQIAPVWESAENLIGCEKLIKRFFNQNGLTTIKESCVMDETASDVDKHVEDNAMQAIDIFDENNDDNVCTEGSYHEENNSVNDVSGTNTDACLDSDSNDDKDDNHSEGTETINKSVDEDSHELTPTILTKIPFSRNGENTEHLRNCIPITSSGSNLESMQRLNDFPLEQIPPRTESLGGYIKQETRTTDVEQNEILEQIPRLKRPETSNTTVSNCVIKNTKLHDDDDTSGTRNYTHTSLNSYNCNECDISFQTMIDFKFHQTIHNKKQPLVCIQCNVEFNSIYELKFHAKKHSNDRPFKCNECNKTFPTGFDLKRHKYHHRREYTYECDLCNHKFKYSQQLKIHTRIHTGERPYKCNLCEKTFYCKGNLNCHKQTHTIERPFECKQCDKTFKLKGNLRRHEKQH